MGEGEEGGGGRGEGEGGGGGGGGRGRGEGGGGGGYTYSHIPTFLWFSTFLISIFSPSCPQIYFSPMFHPSTFEPCHHYCAHRMPLCPVSPVHVVTAVRRTHHFPTVGDLW